MDFIAIFTAFYSLKVISSHQIICISFNFHIKENENATSVSGIQVLHVINELSFYLNL